jgi:N-acetyl-anhydromuramyl-L-alanine amidase AmpD
MGWLSNLFGGSKPKPQPATPVAAAAQKYEEVKAQPVPQFEVFKPEAMVPTKYKPIQPLDLMKVNYVESPNKGPREDELLYIVLHHTGPGAFNGILKWLCDPAAKASAHYLLGTAAELTQMVNTSKKAWHAGVSKWDGRSDINRYSVGIEICNIGRMEKMDDGFCYYEVGRELKKYTGSVPPLAGSITYPSGKVVDGHYVPYPTVQIEKLVALCKGLVKKYPAITKKNIITHYDIGQPEGRKNDPFGLDVEMIREWVFEGL